MTQVSETTLRTQITECTRMMVMAELLDYSGHVSARIPGTDRFLIPPRDASRAGLTPDEILVVDINGKVLEGKGPAPTETAIHSGVYRHRAKAPAVNRDPYVDVGQAYQRHLGSNSLQARQRRKQAVGAFADRPTQR